MANKTLKFYGIGYAPTGQSASITVTYDGTTIFSGVIPSIATTDPTPDPTQYDEIFTYDVDGNLVATVPMTVTVTGGDAVTLGRVEVNSLANVAFFETMCTQSLGDCRSDVVIDGIAQSKGALGDILTGAWSWNVDNASTLGYNLHIVVPEWGNVAP